MSDGQFCWLPEFEPDHYQERAEEIERAGEFGAIRQGNAGETLSYAALAPTALEAHEQLELNLSGYSARRAVRIAVADLIDGFRHEREYLESWPERLRAARNSAHSGIRMNNGKRITLWDNKAGLSRICPDDARDEAMRLARKNVPHLVKLQETGHTLFYSVLTMRNFPRGNLLDGMREIFDRLKRLVLHAKDADGEPVFPEIKGALCVLEAPLGRSRDWNVHLNVIFVVKGQWLDWEKLRAKWHWDLHITKLAKGEEAIRAALTELIKYAVAATVAKSAQKAVEHEQSHTELGRGDSDGGAGFIQRADLRGGRRTSVAGSEEAPAGPDGTMAAAGAGRSGLDSDDERALREDSRSKGHPPPLLEWTKEELLEWFDSFHGFRRTRSYGVMYGLQKPEREEIGPVIWLWRIGVRDGRYVATCPLLSSIPEDKFSGRDAAERWLAFIQSLAPGGLAGAGSLGETIPRLTAT